MSVLEGRELLHISHEYTELNRVQTRKQNLEELKVADTVKNLPALIHCIIRLQNGAAAL